MIINAREAYSRAYGLISRVVPDLKVRVVESLLAGDTLCRVKVEQLREEVDRERVCTWEEGRKRYARLDGQRANIVLSL